MSCSFVDAVDKPIDASQRGGTQSLQLPERVAATQEEGTRTESGWATRRPIETWNSRRSVAQSREAFVLPSVQEVATEDTEER